VHTFFTFSSTSLPTFSSQVALLLAAEGLDVNARDVNDGRTALMCAADALALPRFASERRPTEVLRLLLAAEGIDVNAEDSRGATALVRAASDGNVEVLTPFTLLVIPLVPIALFTLLCFCVFPK